MNREQALARAAAAIRPDPGTNRRPATDRQGTVTAATVGSIACEVDGLPATNITGWNLDVGEKVMVKVTGGARYVTHVFAIKE